ncbi:addiction module toxin, RelE/StbE family (plasmid) [Piscirickettsia salmonis]|uniref:type II toxin-antitoxin system RelE family toxin n=1 Tax=Piscirickettsia salmonis TaxID=1238 RepID=UPI0012B71957|nr:type II toxin-antitoxin system RelE/ParE family toxin [Piscirickettsia salmonis]QGP52422.1 addiction module toxin, RelE/StbE family [Piscirickettsia salmonis]
MPTYELRFKKSAIKDLTKITKSLPKSKRRLLKEQIDSLSYNPQPENSKKLKGYDSLYRVNMDNYRVVYTIEKGCIYIIEVILVAHRGEVYKLLKQMKVT